MNAKRIARLLAVLVLALVLLPTVPVLAIANPDVGPTIEQVDIYRHCLEEDDMVYAIMTITFIIYQKVVSV